MQHIHPTGPSQLGDSGRLFTPNPTQISPCVNLSSELIAISMVPSSLTQVVFSGKTSIPYK